MIDLSEDDVSKILDFAKDVRMSFRWSTDFSGDHFFRAYGLEPFLSGSNTGCTELGLLRVKHSAGMSIDKRRHEALFIVRMLVDDSQVKCEIEEECEVGFFFFSSSKRMADSRVAAYAKMSSSTVEELLVKIDMAPRETVKQDAVEAYAESLKSQFGEDVLVEVYDDGTTVFRFPEKPSLLERACNWMRDTWKLASEKMLGLLEPWKL